MALAFRKSSMTVSKPASSVSRVSAPRAVRPTPSRMVVRSNPQEAAALQEAMKKAQECTEPAECATAWDNVEEISAAIYHHKQEEATQDPMEKFCEGNEDADECRVFDT